MAKFDQFGVMCCIYDEPEYLNVAFEPIMHMFGKVLFVMAAHAWHDRTLDNRSTVQAIESLCLRYSNCELLRSDCTVESDLRNQALAHLKSAGSKYCLIIDSDEIYYPDHLANFCQHILKTPTIAAFHLTFKTYWTKHYYRIDPPEDVVPLVACEIERIQFTHIRGGKTGHYSQSGQFTEDSTYQAMLIPSSLGTCFHLSYARSDAFVHQKITTGSHSVDVQPNWFERIWKTWTPAMTDLHPMEPAQFKRAIPEDFTQLPSHLQHFIKQEQLPQRTPHIIVLEQLSQTDSLQQINAINQWLSTHYFEDVLLVSPQISPSEALTQTLHAALLSTPQACIAGLAPELFDEPSPQIRGTQTHMLPQHALYIMREVFDKVGLLDASLMHLDLAVADLMVRAALARFITLAVDSPAHIIADRQSSYINILLDPALASKYYRTLFAFAPVKPLFTTDELTRSLALRLPRIQA